jgi:hypothetical protein
MDKPKVFLCRLNTDINKEAYIKFKKSVDVARARGKPGDIFLFYVWSPGGEVYWAYRMARDLGELLSDGFETVAMAYKGVHSAALMPYLACSYRVARGEPTFLFHEIAGYSKEYESEAMKDRKSFCDFVSRRTLLGSKRINLLIAANKGMGTYMNKQDALFYRVVNYDYTKEVAQVA